MVEVRITYETLFDLLRREKGRNELQELSATFFVDVVTYLKEKTSMLSESTSALTSRAEHEKTKIQIKNIRKILKELYELREKKIISLAINKVKAGSNLVDTSKMLPEERQLFEETAILLTKFKQGILDHVSRMELPSIVTDKDYTKVKMHKDFAEEIEEEPKEESEEQMETQVADKSSIELEVPVASPTRMKVKFLSNLPKFMGPDKAIYGPYNREEIAELPVSVANLLMKKSRAEPV